MKKVLLVFLCLGVFAFTACSGNDDEIEPKEEEFVETPTEDKKEEPIYYIKYEVESYAQSNPWVRPKFEQTLTFTTETGQMKSVTLASANSHQYSVTHGPFNKGETVKFTASSAYNNTIRIYACRGEEPFVIKAEKQVTNASLSLTYTIDF